MLFSSIPFLYWFLPAVILCYFALVLGFGKIFGKKAGLIAGNAVLLGFSLVFYGWGEPVYLFLMIATIALNYLFGLQIRKCQLRLKSAKMPLVLGIIANLLILGFFKYAGFLAGVLQSIGVPVPVPEIALPIGISFYTFQLLTYVVDVYRGDAPAQKSYWNVLLYAALFHQCIAGPIVRYRTIDRELFSGEPRRPEVAEGVSRFAAGLAKMGFESVLNCILVAVVPFNIIKGVVISAVTFILYKRLSKLLHKLAGKKA